MNNQTTYKKAQNFNEERKTLTWSFEDSYPVILDYETQIFFQPNVIEISSDINLFSYDEKINFYFSYCFAEKETHGDSFNNINKVEIENVKKYINFVHIFNEFVYNASFTRLPHYLNTYENRVFLSNKIDDISAFAYKVYPGKDTVPYREFLFTISDDYNFFNVNTLSMAYNAENNNYIDLLSKYSSFVHDLKNELNKIYNIAELMINDYDDYENAV